MASQYIKIFNDTVLKQSILQGYESQRQNPNLGKFTSGELAFTRDTGRVFVGNYSDNPTDNDLEIVNGGILIGNKYLGIIDSRPLDYVGDTSFGGLNYEQSNNEEEGMFTTNHRVKKNNNPNDWKNEPSFNPTYGTYNGDYLYDVWRNALIIFDNNIKPNSNEVNVKNPFTKEEEIYDKLGNEISQTGTIRTPIDDWTTNDNMKDYPIYGNGYVIFRVIEPDGETIKFKSRGKISNNTLSGDSICNWTHNILEVQFTPTNLINAFNQDYFGIITKDNKPCITIKDINFSQNSQVEFPASIKFSSSTDGSIIYDFVTDLASSLKDANTNENCILGYTYNKTLDTKSIKIKKITTNELSEIIRNLIPEEEGITITAGDNLIVTESGSNFHIEFQEKQTSTGFQDPWGSGVDCSYFGTGKIENGKLKIANDYEPIFKETIIEDASGKTTTVSAEENKENFKNIIKKFIADDVTNDEKYWNCNVGLNYLKNPCSIPTSCDSIGDIKDGDIRLIPDHAESIILLVTTSSSTTSSSPAEIYITECNTAIFKSSQKDFTSTVEIPLILKTTSETEDNIVTYETVKTYSFSNKNCTVKLLGYRL